MTRFAAIAVLVTLAPAVRAGEPSYQRHVAALLSKLGCNGGTCHGAVRGQNGFRLSLFGADPAGDHQRLLREFGGRRLNHTDPAASLLLRKATGEVEHGGGCGGGPTASSTTFCSGGSPAGPWPTPRYR